ncbi:acetyltransferase, GNAT family protein 19 [Pseudomonas putida S610]|nr:acetyltransferase, GNAT family protein 19 [Pseudomonas putida S610]
MPIIRSCSTFGCAPFAPLTISYRRPILRRCLLNYAMSTCRLSNYGWRRMP